MKGRVTFFNAVEHVGIIVGDDGREYFMHGSSLRDASIRVNDIVEFESAQDDQGLRAVNVFKPL